MKVIVSNKFYYPRGGDCVCTINLEELLKQKGHEVAVFFHAASGKSGNSLEQILSERG